MKQLLKALLISSSIVMLANYAAHAGNTPDPSSCSATRDNGRTAPKALPKHDAIQPVKNSTVTGHRPQGTAEDSTDNSQPAEKTE